MYSFIGITLWRSHSDYRSSVRNETSLPLNQQKIKNSTLLQSKSNSANDLAEEMNQSNSPLNNESTSYNRRDVVKLLCKP